MAPVTLFHTVKFYISKVVCVIQVTPLLEDCLKVLQTALVYTAICQKTSKSIMIIKIYFGTLNLRGCKEKRQRKTDAKDALAVLTAYNG